MDLQREVDNQGQPCRAAVRSQGGQEGEVLDGAKAMKRGPPQRTDALDLQTVPDAEGSEGMLAAEHYELIQRRVLIDSLSQRDVARELGVSEGLIMRGNRRPKWTRRSKLRRPRRFSPPFRFTGYRTLLWIFEVFFASRGIIFYCLHWKDT